MKKRTVLVLGAALIGVGTLSSFKVHADVMSENRSNNVVSVYRMYNKRSMEHLYTADKNEYNTLPNIARDWKREGINFKEYSKGGSGSIAVNRVYNPRSGEHIYTKDTYEVSVLKSKGWRAEGISFYAPKSSSKPVYRLYNPAAGLGSHFVTGDGYEKNSLVSRGWKYEGVAWYQADSKPTPGREEIPAPANLVNFAKAHKLTLGKFYKGEDNGDLGQYTPNQGSQLDEAAQTFLLTEGSPFYVGLGNYDSWFSYTVASGSDVVKFY